MTEADIIALLTEAPPTSGVLNGPESELAVALFKADGGDEETEEESGENTRPLTQDEKDEQADMEKEAAEGAAERAKVYALAFQAYIEAKITQLMDEAD
jgi:hypothetical protein|tara:strand:+ start:7936 stop:8232 length:297 start_codon:yes stop_codon:yes gene_type:complete